MNAGASVEMIRALPNQEAAPEVKLSSETTSARRQVTEQHRENLSRAMKKWWVKGQSAIKYHRTSHAPLHPLDTETQTSGCRHANPYLCGRYRMPYVFALCKKDKICLSPPRTWKNRFAKLKAKTEAVGRNGGSGGTGGDAGERGAR
jgi:hypothetical protein